MGLRGASLRMTAFCGALKNISRTGPRNCRSLGFAPPDFLWELVALSHFMRLSLAERRTHGLVQRSVAGNPGRDDKGDGGGSMESICWSPALKRSFPRMNAGAPTSYLGPKWAAW
jgi:hypothetical protein